MPYVSSYQKANGTGGFLAFDVWCIATWTNNESSAHTVEISINDGLLKNDYGRGDVSRNIKKVYRGKGSTEAYIKLATYTANPNNYAKVNWGGVRTVVSDDDLYQINCSVSVRLLSGSTSSSAASASSTINPSFEPTFGTNASWDNATQTLHYPTWNGVLWAPIVRVLDIEAPTDPRLYTTAGIKNIFVQPIIQSKETAQSPSDPRSLLHPRLIKGKTYQYVLTNYKNLRTVFGIKRKTLPSHIIGFGGPAGALQNLGQAFAYFAATEENRTGTGRINVWSSTFLKLKSIFERSATALHEELFLTPEALSGDSFTATAQNVNAVVGESVSIRLTSSHPATWAVNSGLPSGFSIKTSPGGYTGVVTYTIVGTATTAGVYTIALTATRISNSATSACNIILVVAAKDNGANTVQIQTNPGWANNGLSYKVGDTISLQLSANPSSGIVWSATGLPQGVTIEPSTGMISGLAETEGRFSASVVASSETDDGFKPSLPASITFTIKKQTVAPPPVLPPTGTPGTITPGTGAPSTSTPDSSEIAANRIPWIVGEWQMTDLQVLARTRAVQSTLLPKTGMRIKVGDNINFAVFFVGADDLPFALAPDRLRITIRPADNLEGSLVFDSESTPAAVTTEPDPYYLLAVSTAGRQRQIVQEWVEDTGKNEPLPCVADVDWTKDGQHFSSASFPVLLELDVTRP